MHSFFKLLLLSLLFVNPYLFAAEIEETTQEVVEVPKFIALSDVPKQAVETLKSLKEIKETFAGSEAIQESHLVLPAYMEGIEPYLAIDINDISKQRNIRDIQKNRANWKVYQSKLEEWSQEYSERIAIYDEKRKELEAYSKLWSETHINANAKGAPEVIQNHIANVIIAIEELRSLAKANYDMLLTDDNSISTMLSRIEERIEKLNETEALLIQNVFYHNRLPLLDAFGIEPFSPIGFVSGIVTNISEKLNEFKIYFLDHPTEKNIMAIAILFVIGFIGYFYWLFRQKKLFVEAISRKRKAFFFITRPISTAILLIALIQVGVYTEQTQAVKDMIIFIIFIPVVRIILLVLHSKVTPYLLAYFVLIFFDLMERNTLNNSLDDRLLLIMINLGMIALIVTFMKNKVIESFNNGVIKSVFYKLLPLIALLFVASIMANINGMVYLSERITHGVFGAIQSAIIFYALTIILSGYVIIMIRRRIAIVSNLLDKFADQIERNVTLFIKLFMVLWWFKLLIRTLGFEASFNELIDEILAQSWIVGTTTISVDALVSFVFILIGTWVLSRVVQMFLEVEVFSRVHFSRGVPTAIATVSNYIIIISGLLIAISSLGVTTQQLALVFGALGVGIGFGLRNIIANFISGVIMVFERPIQIGDTIEVDNTMGKVLHIGTRASSIKTFDGSEVIVPNESFISSKIINWTLSDERRRKVLQIKVDFDSDIETVLEIMRSVAISHKSVLKDPEPLPAFEGFGDYYLEFKLYYWLADNLIVAQSDVAIGVYKKLKEANIATPMPIQKLVMPQDEK